MILQLFADSSSLFSLQPRTAAVAKRHTVLGRRFIKQITAGDLICLLPVRPAFGLPVYVVPSPSRPFLSPKAFGIEMTLTFLGAPAD
jgi:hypothetical protein